MSGASTQPASACGDGADAVDLLAPWQAPPSLKAPPSPAKSNSIITAAANPMEDFIANCRKVHSYLTSARTLSQELQNLQITQQTQRESLERRIDECYQQAYNLSELTC